MNILPKKRWHVRTRENIARVRKDEAAAAEEEKKKQFQVELAEKEARTQFLRNKARENYDGSIKEENKIKKEDFFADDKHVNLFYELESKSVVSNKTNADHELEKKLEKEKYEKQIGYLTYLGQDTNEATGNISWYNKVPDRLMKKEKEEDEVGVKDKKLSDPLNDIRHYLGTKGVKKITSEKSRNEVNSFISVLPKVDNLKSKKSKHKRKDKKKHKKSHKHKKQKKKVSSSEISSSDEELKQKKRINLERLRMERLKRERDERLKSNLHLAKLRGDPVEPPEKQEEPVIIQKYNSQFNPHLANQNFRD